MLLFLIAACLPVGLSTVHSHSRSLRQFQVIAIMLQADNYGTGSEGSSLLAGERGLAEERKSCVPPGERLSERVSPSVFPAEDSLGDAFACDSAAALLTQDMPRASDCPCSSGESGPRG